ncbi:RING-H2 finger protein ATL56 [Ziziphus jujuba]|uniref:RING-H2 finger protein ATL56 n=2 Tax=Ziziphus jujuba TaxID=326968 RepID=A0ABM3IS03_ZIZJJ|nr:RING-H2 finger protein ATL56 [Ziziphus jujuba]KAH7545248.1 hypothetical protein FEM48_Zijuj01G0073600 [Ziziphus jujuba var. spinosa]
MPPHHHHQPNRHGVQSPSPKPNQKFLFLILKVVIMTFITTLFFLFLGVAAMLLLCLAGGALHGRRRRTHFPYSSNGLFPEDLIKLPQFRYAKRIERQEEAHSECVVCLDRFREGQWCRKLVGCNHVFHRSCLDTWLVKVAACPICRTRVGLNQPVNGSTVGVEEEAKLVRFW